MVVLRRDIVRVSDVYRCCNVLALSLFLVVGIAPVSAQDAQSELERQVDEFAERTQSGRDGASRRHKMQAEEQLAAFDSTFERTDRVSTPNPRFEIVSHHRGSQGTPFPVGSEVVLEAITSPAETKRPPLVADYWVLPPRQVFRPSKCAQSKTDVRRRREQGDTSRMVLDRLYVSQALTPLDVSEIYGNSTKVHIYDGEIADEVIVRMEGDRVPCVPYRIRYTETHVFYHSGEDALANFDKDPLQRGELHAWVRKTIGKLQAAAF